MSDGLHVWIGTERFESRLRRDLAPRFCERLLSLLPYIGQVIHARWSGEAMWSPLTPALPADWLAPPEHATGNPAPGEILLYAGRLSEPELYIPYGMNRFACMAGPLEGDPVIAIEGRLDRLAALGRETSWKGAMELRIEVSP